MMNHLVLLIFLISIPSPIVGRGVNGGIECGVCTVLTGLVMQIGEIRGEDFLNAARHLCNDTPAVFRNYCFETISVIEPYFVNISIRSSPDLFCLVHGSCRVDEDERFCNLFPVPPGDTSPQELYNSQSALPNINICDFPVIKDICQILDNSYTTLNPAIDLDGDGFSAFKTARGAFWRGRDCQERDSSIYPGRIPMGGDLNEDTNCNGIWGNGNNTSANMSWEEILCGGSGARGIIFLGDSIGAHFHFPEVWMDPKEFLLPTLNASAVLLNEIDWPQFGFATGYDHIAPNKLIGGVVDSVYLKLRARNRCNHRDYQNLCQNGASSYDGAKQANAIYRNRTSDIPAIVIFAMQGNDICNSYKDTINETTNPEVFKENVLNTLAVLDKKLPPKSHVILMGLIKADFIYGVMADRIHPLGTLHNNIRYKDMYEWFNCMQIGPCTGWLQKDAHIRYLTTKRSQKLTRILIKIAKLGKYRSFDLHFIENPINIIMRTRNVSIPDLLESVDSLHPNQKAQVLMAETVWTSLAQLPPEVLGPVNPKNNLIESIFGDQGGH